MASVNVTGMKVLNNPGSFLDPFRFEITFECVRELNADLEWRLTYVGSAESEECDQELESVLVGPVTLGVNRFILETPPPDHTKIPKQDLLGVTVCLVSSLYKGKEFIRIGYYVNNEYDDPSTGQLLKASDEGMDIDQSDGEDDDGEDDDGEDDDDEDDDDDDGEEGNAELTDRGADEGKENQKTAPPNEEQVVVDKVAGKDTSKRLGKESIGKDANKARKVNESDVKMDQLNEHSSSSSNSPPVPFELPPNFSVEKIKRNILDDKPRLTRFAIDWDE